jgi:DNA-binding transcriptional MerR regulator
MMPPQTAADLLERRRDRLDAELATRREEQERIGHLPELLVIESRYRIAVLDAERAFVADLAARIRDRSVGGYDWWQRLHDLLAEGLTMEEIGRRLEAGDFGEEAAALFAS